MARIVTGKMLVMLVKMSQLKINQIKSPTPFHALGKTCNARRPSYTHT